MAHLPMARLANVRDSHGVLGHTGAETIVAVLAAHGLCPPISRAGTNGSVCNPSHMANTSVFSPAPLPFNTHMPRGQRAQPNGGLNLKLVSLTPGTGVPMETTLARRNGNSSTHDAVKHRKSATTRVVCPTCATSTRVDKVSSVVRRGRGRMIWESGDVAHYETELSELLAPPSSSRKSA